MVRKKDDLTLYIKFEKAYNNPKYFGSTKTIKISEGFYIPFRRKGELLKQFIYYNS